jgi:hypothetical protein
MPRPLAIVAVLAVVVFGGAYLATHSGASDSGSSSAVEHLKVTPASISGAVTKAAAALPSLGSVPHAAAPPATSSPSTGAAPSGNGGGGGSGGSGGSGGTIIQG